MPRAIVGLVGQCHRVVVPSWVFRGSEIFSRGYFVGFNFFLVGVWWILNFSSSVFRLSKFFSRGYFVGSKFFLVRFRGFNLFFSHGYFIGKGPYLFFSCAYNFVIQIFNCWLHEKLWQKIEMQISNQVLFSKSISAIDLFSIVTYSIIAHHISLVKVQTNYYNNNILILDVKKLNKMMKLYHFHNLKALWDGQGKTKMYFGMYRVKKKLSGKMSIVNCLGKSFLQNY